MLYIEEISKRTIGLAIAMLGEKGDNLLLQIRLYLA